MNPFEFVLALIAIITIGRVVQQVLKSRAHGHGGHDRPETLQAFEEVRQLKERIQVLERVITDNHGSRRLDDEIERLRDR